MKQKKPSATASGLVHDRTISTCDNYNEICAFERREEDLSVSYTFIFRYVSLIDPGLTLLVAKKNALLKTILKEKQ